MVDKNDKKRHDADTKLELANKIARQSKKVAKTYASLEDSFLSIFRGFSSWIDKALFSSRYAKIVSLILAILIYITINFNSENALFSTTMQSSKEKVGVSITALYNTETFEISGLPDKADITITGDASSVNTAFNHAGYIVANLEGLTEGVHNIKLKPEGFSQSVSVKIDPSNVQISLKKKTTRQYDLAYDFINADKMENIYTPGEPIFEFSKINVRASKDTLDSIAFVKALIDVSNKSAEFTQEAILVAYDKTGQPVKADIVPNVVKVTVPVTSPSATVPVAVEIVGNVVEGMAIDSIGMDHQTVTIYAPETVLTKIDQVIVILDASTITKDSIILRPITLPTGVNSSTINQINMDVKLAPIVSKVVEGININYKNNVNSYRFNPENSEASVSVEVVGTQKNIDKITADDIEVYFDMKDSKPGEAEFELFTEAPKNPFVKYTLQQKSIKGSVIGEEVSKEVKE